MYLLQHYLPFIFLQCWQTCRNRQGCVSTPTLSSFHLFAILADLLKQTRMCIYYNIILLPILLQYWKTCRNKQGYVSGFYIILLPSCCNVAKLPKTNKGCVPGSNIILLPSCSNVDKLRRNKQGCLSVSTLSSFYLAVMLANVQKQTRMCICSNIIFLPSC